MPEIEVRKLGVLGVLGVVGIATNEPALFALFALFGLFASDKTVTVPPSRGTGSQGSDAQ